ncbi:DUF2007 domain-containing protein [Aquimarina sp. 2201CG1-2-11]|uniref:putative signal transducing protein n=1 Tax=Aquimarina discodermiae TaxID=3231043 RepID=UPI0034634336
MFHESEYERVYTGSLVIVQFLQNLLQENEIGSITRDDMKSGMMAGFGGGVPHHIQLFVKKNDLEEALPIIKNNI